MKLDISNNEVRISFSEKAESDYMKTVLDRLVFLFKPEITTWVHGVKVVGQAKQVGMEEVK